MFAFPPFLAPASVYSRLLNTLLQREDWARERLAAHAGKTACFKLGRARVRLTIDATGLTQPSDPAVVPDVTLAIASEHVSQLPGLLKAKDPAQLTRIMHIQGDAGLAQAVSDLARDLRWDAEHDLARYVGDITARRLVRGSAALAATARQSTRHLANNAAEFLTHESGIMASRPALAVFSANLQAVSQKLTALERRIDTLADRSATGSTPPHTRRRHV